MLHDQGIPTYGNVFWLAHDGTAKEMRQWMDKFGEDTIRKRDYEGRTVITHACMGANASMLKYLLTQRVPVSDRDAVASLEAWSTECFLMVIQRLDPCANKLVLDATIHNNPDGVHTLVNERGCDPNVRDRHGRTPLHLACYHGFYHILGIKGADTTAVDKYGRTPMDLAVAYGQFICIDVMVENAYNRGNHKELLSSLEPLSRFGLLDYYRQQLRHGPL